MGLLSNMDNLFELFVVMVLVIIINFRKKVGTSEVAYDHFQSPIKVNLLDEVSTKCVGKDARVLL